MKKEIVVVAMILEDGEVTDFLVQDTDYQYNFFEKESLVAFPERWSIVNGSFENGEFVSDTEIKKLPPLENHCEEFPFDVAEFRAGFAHEWWNSKYHENKIRLTQIVTMHNNYILGYVTSLNDTIYTEQNLILYLEKNEITLANVQIENKHLIIDNLKSVEVVNREEDSNTQFRKNYNTFATKIQIAKKTKIPPVPKLLYSYDFVKYYGIARIRVSLLPKARVWFQTVMNLDVPLTIIPQPLFYWRGFLVESIAGMFSGMEMVSCNLNFLNTYNIMDMSDLFLEAKIDKVRMDLDFRATKTMEQMFKKAKIKTLTIETGQTQKVQNFKRMFRLARIDVVTLAKFDFSGARDISEMFCVLIGKEMDLSHWDFSTVPSKAKVKDLFYSIHFEDFRFPRISQGDSMPCEELKETLLEMRRN